MSTETIDITPTWKGVLRLMVEVASNGVTSEGRSSAWGELTRMADMADRYVAEHKNEGQAQASGMLTDDTARVEACLAWVKLYGDTLDKLEVPPIGDDYNDLVGGVVSLLRDGISMPIDIETEGR